MPLRSIVYSNWHKNLYYNLVLDVSQICHNEIQHTWAYCFVIFAYFLTLNNLIYKLSYLE